MAEYIEREAFLEKMKGTNRYFCVKFDIEEFPAADVAPVVHGRWVQTEYWRSVNKHSILYKTNRCSVCNCDISSRLLYNYCPHCGARMDGE